MKRFDAYDSFAWLYANYWGDAFHREVREPLERALLSKLPQGAKVLDLCCGDGRLTALLVERGFAVTGLDGSEHMLAYARQRCPRTPFLLADARGFELPPRFDAVVSTFDSLNHVMTTQGLSQVFHNVYRCLRPGGRFVFDLNREEAYRDSWIKTGSIVLKDVVSVSRGIYLPEKRLAVCDITLMRRRNGKWERSDFQMREKFHRTDTVVAKLKAAGFDAEVYDAGSLGMRGEIGQGRDFYVAQKRRQR